MDITSAFRPRGERDPFWCSYQFGIKSLETTTTTVTGHRRPARVLAIRGPFKGFSTRLKLSYSENTKLHLKRRLNFVYSFNSNEEHTSLEKRDEGK